MFERILINRIKKGVDKVLRKEQAGFREKRSTTEQIVIIAKIIIKGMAASSMIIILPLDAVSIQ